jgi:hypothetical protein
MSHEDYDFEALILLPLPELPRVHALHPGEETGDEALSKARQV